MSVCFLLVAVCYGIKIVMCNGVCSHMPTGSWTQIVSNLFARGTSHILSCQQPQDKARQIMV